MKRVRRGRIILFVAAVAVLMGGGCAYFNMYYNAETAFETARRAHRKLIRTTTDTTATVPSEITANYDRAIEKARMVIDVYPKQSDWHDDAVFLMGKASFYKKDMAGAIRRFLALQEEYATSPLIPEALVYLGRAYMEDGNLLKAENTLIAAKEKFPSLDNGDQITLLLAEIAIRREGKAQAIEMLNRILASVSGDEQRIEIMLKLARLHMDQQQYSEAVSVLKKAPRKRDFAGYLYRVDYALLVCYIGLGDDPAAEVLANRMLKDRDYAGHTGEILLKKGIALARMGHSEEALLAFTGVTEGSGAKAAIQGEAWFEAAKLYQFTLRNFEKALECYGKAANLATDPEIRRIALDRSDALTWIASYQDSLSKSTQPRAKADSAEAADTALVRTENPHVRIAEVYWLRLEEPDSALAHYRLVEKDTTATLEETTQALFAGAWILRAMKRDTAASDSLYRLVILRHKSSMYAKRAQEELGLPVTIMTRRDSAHVAYLEAERLLYDDNRPIAAVNAFHLLSKRYTDLPDVSAQSLYTTAWVCDNILRKPRTARDLYTLLCDSFPETPYCIESARPRLQHVEDTLRVIREKELLEGKTSSKLTDIDDSDTDHGETVEPPVPTATPAHDTTPMPSDSN